MQEGVLSPLLQHCQQLVYVGSHSELKFYGADFMCGDERTLYSACYEGAKDKIFDSGEDLLAFCMDDVNILRQACRAFRNLFLKLVKKDPFGKPLEYHPFATRCSGPCF